VTDTFQPIGEVVAGIMDRLAEGNGLTQVWDGQPIRTPGIYRDVPSDVYHGAKLCDGPSVSSSGLRTIELESPAHYWCRSPYNPNREPDEASDALDFGRAAHTLLLGEEGFRRLYAVRPEEWTDWRKAAAQEWRDAMRAAGKSVLTPDQVEHIKRMADALDRHPLVKGGLLHGEVERTIVWRDTATGVWCKARPDVLARDTVIVDLKTCQSTSRVAVERAIGDYGLHMQLAMIGMGIEAVTGRTPGHDDYVLLFVEKAPPYAVRVAPVAIEAIWYGRRQIRRALDTFAKCIASGDWPSCTDDLSTVFLPKWMESNLKFQAENGLLPEEHQVERTAA
jgi:hypothetical protein